MQLLNLISVKLQAKAETDPSRLFRWQLLRNIAFMRWPLNDGARIQAITDALTANILEDFDGEKLSQIFDDIDRLLQEAAACMARAEALIITDMESANV